MKRSIQTVALAALLLAGASSFAATNAAVQGRENDSDCLFFRTIHDWRALDSTHMVVWGPGTRNPYLVTLTFPLPDLKWAFRLAFVDGNRDGNLCSFGRDSVVVPNGFTSWRSSIRGISRLDEESVAALEDQYNVKLQRNRGKDSNKDAKVS
jgi:hypothetical protein